jgi:ribonuclease P protein component
MSLRVAALVLHNKDVPATTHSPVLATAAVDHRLRKHADYQRVYRDGRKNFSASMSYFYALRAAGSPVPPGPRVGLTAGKVLGKAVERNRIKRRMRDIVRRNRALVRADVDIVLHPRRSVLTIEFAKLESEVMRIFINIQSAIDKGKMKQAPQELRVGS